MLRIANFFFKFIYLLDNLKLKVTEHECTQKSILRLRFCDL